MLELASSGARVLMSRSVEYGRRYGVRIHVRSSFADEPGTWVTEEDVRMEQAMISGVAADPSEAKVAITGVPDRPGVAADLFDAIAGAGIGVDMVVQPPPVGREHAEIAFLVARQDLSALNAILEGAVAKIGAGGFVVDDDVAKISLVGAGIRSHPQVFGRMLRALADQGINIEMISMSSIRISCVIRADRADDAVRAVHAAFGIAEETAVRAEHTGEIPAIRPEP
jgi:aspartate kinase